ncbi:DotI/IcmL/TraM family protein [Pseudomonas syringae]|uniref:DotI/IcmL/TraM family protein n=1 Tax=Pseudomonas syringae TaxID=317 RepID=UPI001F50F8C6|nr:DotI/IcmL/TraM family protein [Pseudomonas syringae]
MAVAEQSVLQAIVTANEEAFVHAQDAQRQRELGAAFAHRCLTALIWTGSALVLAIVVIGLLAWKVAHPPVKYFTTENGRVIPVRPRDAPAFSDSDVSAFGADTIRRSFTLDFIHYKDQISNVKDDYDDQGFAGYYKALNSSNILASIKDQRMNLSVDVGPGRITNKGRQGDVDGWVYQYPVTLKLDGQVTGSPAQRFIFTQRIQSTDVEKKNKGLEIVQLITSGAN